ncbi:MAG: carbohydrate kinase [Oscillospiraceae bacterium]|nr:carbohydrate kinase [Oscillospiraceae bacterium]
MTDILCVGEMVIDFLPGSEEGTYLRKAGGAPANVAIAAARAGLNTAMCCAVGEDDFGRFLQATLRKNGVRCTKEDRITQATTTMSFVSLDENNDRSFTFARKPGADMFLTVEDVRKAGPDDCVVLHAGSCSLSKGTEAAATVYAMETASEAKKIVSFDMNYRNLLWDDDSSAAIAEVKKILPYVDLLKVSEEEAEMLGGIEETVSSATKAGVSAVVITFGGRGASCFWSGKEFFSPAIRTEVVDTTGAGDAFWGNFLAQLIMDGIRSKQDLTEEILQKAMERGNIAGSLCVRKKGAIEALPDRTEVEEVWRARNEK